MQPDSGQELLTRHHLHAIPCSASLAFQGITHAHPVIGHLFLRALWLDIQIFPSTRVASWAEVILARSRSPTTMLCSSARRACSAARR